MHMIKTWNFDFAGTMVAYVGTIFAEEQKEKQRSQHIIPREIKSRTEIWLSAIKERNLVMSEQIIDT